MELISIKDRLHEIEGHYLVYTFDESTDCASWSSISFKGHPHPEWRILCECCNAEGDTFNSSDVTHWMLCLFRQQIILNKIIENVWYGYMESRIEYYEEEDGEKIRILQYNESGHLTDDIFMYRETALKLCKEIISMLEPEWVK